MKSTRWLLLFANWNYKPLNCLTGRKWQRGVQGKGELIQSNDVIFRLTL